MTGGSIKELVRLYDGVLRKHKEETDRDDDSRKGFTENIMAATSVLMESECGWKEIQSDDQRFQATSDILKSIDFLGYIFGTRSQQLKSCDGSQSESFPTENIQLTIRSIPSGLNGGECFSFSDSGSICLPATEEMTYDDDTCSVHVATAFHVMEESMAMFLTQSLDPEAPSLSKNILGLTIDNGEFSSSENIVVTIEHDTVEVSFK